MGKKNLLASNYSYVQLLHDSIKMLCYFSVASFCEISVAGPYMHQHNHPPKDILDIWALNFWKIEPRAKYVLH